MEKLYRRLWVVAGFVFCSMAFAAGVCFATPIDEGKRLLLSETDAVGAHAQFDEALRVTPAGQPENFWHAVTVVATNDSLKAKLRELNIFGQDDKLKVFDAEGELNYNPEADVENIIMDDDGGTFTGTWYISASDHPYDGQYKYHSAEVSPDNATWTPNIVTTGYYEVYAWVPSYFDNTTDAHYTIAGIPVTTDQKGYGWIPLGKGRTYYFSAGSTTTITLSANASSGRVVADAIKLVYFGDVKDDTVAVFQPAEEWHQVTMAPSAINGNYRWHEAQEVPTATATWSFNVSDTSKKYLVFVHILSVNENAASDVHYSMNGSQIPLDVNQNWVRRDWYSLGVYQFSQLSNTLTLHASSNGSVMADAVRIVPMRPYPDLTASQTLTSDMLVQIDEALLNLGSVTQGFSDTITSDHMPDLNPGEALYLDYGEAKALEAMLYFIKFEVQLNGAYEMANVNILPLIFNEGDLETALFTLDSSAALLTPIAGSDLTASKTALVDAINSYSDASTFIRNDRSDTGGLNHLVMFYEPCEPYDPQHETWEQYQQRYNDWLEEKQDALDMEEYIRGKLTDIENNLLDPTHFPFVIIPAYIEGTDGGPGIEIHVNLYELGPTPKNIRAIIDNIRSELTNRDMFTDGFSDPTLEVVLPNLVPSDYNFLFGFGPELKDVMILWNGDTPSVRLDWDASKDENADHITGYEIYRATNPEFSDGALIGTADPQANTYTDTSLPLSGDLYYYRIHTYYGFSGGVTAETFTEAIKARLRVYVDGTSAAPTEDGSKQAPFKDLGDAIRNEASDGTKVCVARGTYHEAGNSLGLWNKDGLVLEGGYEGTNWTRNIAVNETIIDASGFGDWAAIGLYNVTGVVVDGFTIRNATGQQYSSGIGISQSHSIIIRNCKITNCNRGISVGDGASNVLIDGVTITDITGEGIAMWRAQSVEVKDCTIANSYQMGITINDGSSAIIRNCEVTDNAQGGIAAWSSNASASIIGCHIAQNGSHGIHLQSAATIFNNLIDDNYRDGINCWGNSAANVSIINNTIVNNKEMGGINFGNAPSLWNITIKNNLIANNNGGWNNGIYGGSSTAVRTITNNNSFGHLNLDYASCGTNAGSNGNISAEPLFVTGPRGAYYLRQIASGGASDSPCLNTGNGKAKTFGLRKMTTRTDEMCDAGIVDMGYHYPSTAGNYKEEAVVDFGDLYGIWTWYDNTSWTQLHSVSPVAMVKGDLDGNGKEELIIDFGPLYGIWIRYNDSSWQQLHTVSSKSMVTGDIDGNGKDEVVVDFGPAYGIWIYYNNSSWAQLHTVSSDTMVTGNIDGDANFKDDIIIDFGPAYGVWIRYNDSSWQQLHSVSPVAMVKGDLDGNGKDDLVADFGAEYGIWVYYNNSEWSKLHSAYSAAIVTADLDGNGKKDLIVDFGPDYGIWVYYNNAAWLQLHSVSPNHIASGDLDGNYKDDLVIDFGTPYGIWIRYNDSDWSQLHSVSPDGMVAGDLDGR